MDLSDAHWALVEPLLRRRSKGRPGRRGRPPTCQRRVLSGVLWILRTGARRKDLPKRFPPRSTCHRWLQRWSTDGTLLRVKRKLLHQLDTEGRLRWDEAFIDASFASAKKGGACVGKARRGKGTKWMAVVDGNGLPLALTVHSPSPVEVKLPPDVVAAIPMKKPERLVGDKAYDSEGLVQHLAKAHAVELNRRGKRRTQDGRPLRRYVRRWKVERFFAWLGNYRRLPVRWERRVENYLGFLLLACVLILLRRI